MTDRHPEAGDIILGWLVRIVAIVAVFALVVFEIVAVVLATIRVDEAAVDIARATSTALEDTGSVSAAEEAAAALAAEREVQLEVFTEDEAGVVLEVSKDAETLVLHRLPGTDGLVTRTATRRVDDGA
jgi:hypothetical protein